MPRAGRRLSRLRAKIGCTPQTLNEWVKKAEVDSGQTSRRAERIWRTRLKALERENRELRQANEILRKASRLFCPGGARPPVQAMIAFIDDHREVAWGRADLQGVADRPLDLPCPCRQTRRSGQAVDASEAG